MRTAKVQASLRIRAVSPEPCYSLTSAIDLVENGNFTKGTRYVAL